MRLDWSENHAFPVKHESASARRIAANIAKLPDLLRKP
jgi:hypothetical protein